MTDHTKADTGRALEGQPNQAAATGVDLKRLVGTYPLDWPQIAKRIKDAAEWKCERCGHVHEVATGYVLTVHHLDGEKSNCADWNLAALCQRCHLSVQGRVKMDQMFFAELLDVSEWFKPHLRGYLAARGANARKSRQRSRRPHERPGSSSA